MLFWNLGKLDWTWMEEGIVSSLGHDFLYFCCFQWSSGICWVGVLVPHGMTEKKKPRRRYGQSFKSSWVVLLPHCMNSAGGRNYRAAEVSLPILLSHVRNPLLLVLPFALFWYHHHLFVGKLGLCVRSSQDFTTAWVLQTSRVQIIIMISRKWTEEGTEIPIVWMLHSHSCLETSFSCCFIASPALSCGSSSQTHCKALKLCSAFKLMRVQWNSSGFITKGFSQTFMACAS